MPHDFVGDPWERQPGETEAAYRCFLVYRDLGDDRSITQAHLKTTPRKGKKRGPLLNALRDWSGTHRWVERCRLWDNHLQAERDRVAASEARKWEARRLQDRERNHELSERLRDRVIDLLAHPIVRGTTKDGGKTIVVEPAGWSQRDIPLIAKIASDLAGLALADAPGVQGRADPAADDVKTLRDHLDPTRFQPRGAPGAD